jgi:hypothetical protein
VLRRADTSGLGAQRRRQARAVFWKNNIEPAFDERNIEHTSIASPHTGGFKQRIVAGYTWTTKRIEVPSIPSKVVVCAPEAESSRKIP